MNLMVTPMQYDGPGYGDSCGGYCFTKIEVCQTNKPCNSYCGNRKGICYVKLF